MKPTRPAAMNRRTFACGLGSLLAGLPSPASAPGMLGKEWSPWIDPPRFDMASPQYTSWGPWTFIPTIIIVSEPNDPRIPAVHAAVRFWNDVFLQLGSPFRLGRVGHIADSTAADDGRRHFQRELDKLAEASHSGLEPPRFVANLKEHVVVALSDRNSSFAARWHQPRKALAVISALRLYQSNPPSMPGGFVTENTAAHELGHVIGLGHSEDPRSVMCAPCAPIADEGFRALTDKEKSLLMQMYPRRWPAPS